MTPEERTEFNEMKAFIQSLKAGYSFPRDVSNAMVSRLENTLVFDGTTTAGAQTVISAFPFNLPANPSGAVTVIINGTTYNLLYK